MERPGRGCPPAYGYAPGSLARPAESSAGVLCAFGGLYGNLPALDAIEAMAQAERPAARLVFKGDFRRFDAEAAWFAEADARVAARCAVLAA